MDTEVALGTTARPELGAVLRAAQKRQPWYYALSGVASDDLTLASLLHLTPEQSDQLLPFLWVVNKVEAKMQQ